MSEQQKFKELQDILPNVSRETFIDLCVFSDFVLQWSTHINLIAEKTKNEIWTRHILDCVQLWLYLTPESKTILDLGAGGGFPGIVLAILAKHLAPQKKIILVESNRKKAAFLQYMIVKLHLPAQIYAERIEKIDLKQQTINVITARALASLSDLFTFSYPYLTAENFALLQKGRDYQEEIDKAGAHWQFNLLKYKSLIDSDSVILKISDLKAKISD